MSLSGLSDMHRRAIEEFEARFRLREAGGEVLDLSPDPREPGVFVVRVRISDITAPPAAPARPATSVSAAAPVEAPEPAREPSDDAAGVFAAGVEEDVMALIGREDARLRLPDPAGARGGFGNPLLEPEERIRLLAYALIGDVLGNAVTKGVEPESAETMKDLEAAASEFREEATRLQIGSQWEIWTEALQDQAPAGVVGAYTRA